MTARLALRWLGPVWGVWALAVLVAFALAPHIPRGPQVAYLTECRGWENIALADVSYGLSMSLTCNRSGKSQMAWSPDGRYLAYYSNASAIFTLNVLDMDAGDTQSYWFEDRIYANIQQGISWSPDSAYIAFVGITPGNTPQTLFRLELATSDVIPLTAGERDALDPQWSPLDLNTLLFRRGDGLYTLNPFDSTEPEQPAAPLSQHIYTPDGASVRFSYEMPVISIEGPGAALRQLDLPTGIRLREISPSPAAERLAVVQATISGMSIVGVDTATGETVPFASSPGYIGQPAWSPDGGWVAFVQSLRSDDLFLYNVARRRVQQVTTGPQRDWYPLWRPPA